MEVEIYYKRWSVDLRFSCFQVVRVLRGQGDQWDNRARSRGVTASFSLNGIGLVPEETPDLYQENEELKVNFLLLITLANTILLPVFFNNILKQKQNN